MQKILNMKTSVICWAGGMGNSAAATSSSPMEEGPFPPKLRRILPKEVGGATAPPIPTSPPAPPTPIPTLEEILDSFEFDLRQG